MVGISFSIFWGVGIDANMLPQDSRLGVPGVPLPQSEQFVCEMLAATARGNPQKDRVSHVLAITDVDHTSHDAFIQSNERYMIYVEPAVSWQLTAANPADRSRRPRQTSKS
jgi:hypothetical protein